MSEASRLAIRHATTYRYAGSPEAVVQIVRLTPHDAPGQRRLAWRVAEAGGAVPLVFVDGFGNVSHLFRAAPQGARLEIVAEGVVETTGRADRNPDPDPDAASACPCEPLAPAFFLRATPRTTPTPALRAFAVDVRAALPAADRGDAYHEGMRLAERLCESIAHRAGATSVESRADEAFATGAGVCQDRTHLLLLLARELGHPARYISGYWYGAALEDEGAMHAWAEIWHPQRGWLAIDPSSGGAATAAHVRVAIGLDYGDASPLRGMRQGGYGEGLSVSVSIARQAEQLQQ